MLETISHYRIIEKLGEGGMGEVYLAHDTKLNRRVALKLLPPAVSHDRDRLKRFLQEARAAAGLHHPHVAHVYEIGEADGANFIVMEFVQGQTLRDRIAGGPLELEEIITIGEQTADALSEAHAKGITHRDIKPSNLIVTPRGVKVLDFGLAKVSSESTSEFASEIPTAVKTATGAVVGTVAYMSPEQALGGDVDPRSDIFSLGLVLYEMATGRRPFTGKTATETIDQIVHAQPDAIARFNYNVTPELERVIRKALEKEPERRYQSARELLTDLRNLRRDISLSSGAGDVRKPRSSAYLTWFVSFAVLVVLVASIAYWFRQKQLPIDSVVVLPFANDGNDQNMEYLSDGISESLINRLSQLRNLRVVPRNTAFRYKGQLTDPQAIGRALGVRGVIVGSVRQRGDVLNIQAELIDVQNQSQVWGESYQKRATDLLAIQSEIAAGIAEKLRLQLSDADRVQLNKRDTQNPKAYEFYLKGRYFWGKRNEQGIRKGMENFQQAIDLDPTYARAYAGLADCYNFLGAFGIAIMPPGETMPKAKSAASLALNLDESLAEAHTSLAFVRLYYDWDWSGAETGFQRALELNPKYAPAYQWYSHLLMARGQTDESIARANQSVELDPLSLSAHMNVGWQYQWSRQYDLAVDRLHALLEMDPNFEQGRWGLGLAYEGKGSFEQARAEFEEAMKLSGGNAVFVAALGHAYAAGGKKAEGIKIANELEERSRVSYVPPYWMATLYVALDDKEQAFNWLDKAYAERSGGLIWLKVDPRMDPLRSDKRFATLLDRVGIPN